MPEYTARFSKDDGHLSLCLLTNYSSDRHAVLSVRAMLGPRLSHVAIFQESRAVADMIWNPAPPQKMELPASFRKV